MCWPNCIIHINIMFARLLIYREYHHMTAVNIILYTVILFCSNIMCVGQVLYAYNKTDCVSVFYEGRRGGALEKKLQPCEHQIYQLQTMFPALWFLHFYSYEAIAERFYIIFFIPLGHHLNNPLCT